MTDFEVTSHEVRHESLRKALHALGCVWAVWGLYWPLLPVGGLTFFALVYLAYEALRLRGRDIALIEKLGRFIRRPEEESRPALGPIWLAAGIVICFLVFDRRLACAAVLAACGCDCAAGVVGRLWGRVRLPFASTKSAEGTLAGLAVGFLASAPVANVLGAAAAALAASAAELLPLEEMDNLIVPVAAACALALVGM